MVDGIVAPVTEGGDKLGYFLFDLPYLDGQDLARAAGAAKGAARGAGPPRAGAGADTVEHIAGGGADFHREACRLGIAAMTRACRFSKRPRGLAGAGAGPSR